MAGSGKKKRGKLPMKAPLVPPTTTTEVSYREGPTGDDVLGSRVSGSFLFVPDATSARPDDDDEGEEALARTWPQLLDKRVFGLRPRVILFLVWLILMAAIFWQDNAQGKLTDWHNLKWTLTKIGVATLALAAVGVVYKLWDWIPQFGRWLWGKRPWRR